LKIKINAISKTIPWISYIIPLTISDIVAISLSNPIIGNIVMSFIPPLHFTMYFRDYQVCASLYLTVNGNNFFLFHPWYFIMDLFSCLMIRIKHHKRS